MSAAIAAVYAERIRAATHAERLHTIANDTAQETGITAAERAQLQTIFEARCRELWPAAYKRKGDR